MPTSGSFKSQIQIWKNKATSLGQNALVFVLMDYLINYIWVNNLSSAFMVSGQVSWRGWRQPHAGCVPIMYGLLICHTGSSVISGSLEAHAMVPAQACQYLCPWLGVMCHAPAYLVEPCATQPSFWTSCCSCLQLVTRQLGPCLEHYRSPLGTRKSPRRPSGLSSKASFASLSPHIHAATAGRLGKKTSKVPIQCWMLRPP